jgi:hypothetical protein
VEQVEEDAAEPAGRDPRTTVLIVALGVVGVAAVILVLFIVLT